MQSVFYICQLCHFNSDIYNNKRVAGDKIQYDRNFEMVAFKQSCKIHQICDMTNIYENEKMQYDKSFKEEALKLF